MLVLNKSHILFLKRGSRIGGWRMGGSSQLLSRYLMLSAPCDLSCFYSVKVQYIMHMLAGCIYQLHPLSGAAVCVLLKGTLADKMLAKWASGSGWSSGSSSLE